MTTPGDRQYCRRVITIEDVEGERWPEPGEGSTPLVTRCHALRRKSLTEFTVEDLRIMIGQQIAISVLLPLAVDALVADPLAEGDYYPGDLLSVVLRLPDPTWLGFQSDRQRLVGVLTALADSTDDVDRAVEVAGLIARFLRRSSE